MLLIDVNVLLYAHREVAPEHARYLQWLERVANGDEAFGIPDLVFSGFLRIATSGKIFSPPSTLTHALEFVAELRGQPNFVAVNPGPRHWEIFVELCRKARAKGNLISDAYLAALAIETGSEWISTDGDYARFAGLRWKRPF